MANTPKAVRTTAKRHAEAMRKGGELGKLGARTTESSKAWPKMSWDEGIKAAKYVADYGGRNSPTPKPIKADPERVSRSVTFYKYSDDGIRSPR